MSWVLFDYLVTEEPDMSEPQHPEILQASICKQLRALKVGQ